MASRSIWNGTLSFGLVCIPISLHTATETHDVSFRQVHREDGGRIKYRRFCEACDTEVAYGDIAKGYENGEDMIVLGDTDLADLPLPTAKTLEVLQFVDPDDVDPLMFSKSYYIKPGKAAGNAFALLAEAMASTGKAGIVKLALRQRESLGLLQLDKAGGLSLIMLLWPDEVRDAPKPEVVNLNPALVTQAKALVNALSGTFDPGQYTDEYASAVGAMIQAKVSGETLPTATEAPAPVTTDLASVLAASVAAAKKK